MSIHYFQSITDCFTNINILQSVTQYLSVTSCGNVLLIDGLSSTLYIYGPDAQLVHAIRLPSDMRHPRHAVETTTGNFVICHGWKDDLLNRVCEVTKDGRVIRSYSGDPVVGGGTHVQLNTPLHVAIDAEGRVYVADCFNARVVVLHSSLSLLRVIQTSDEQVGGGRPWSICYSPDSRQLIVGLACGRVDVLRVDKFKHFD